MKMIMYHYMIELTSTGFLIIDTTDYWLFAQEYSVWNTVVTTLQFWMAYLNPQTRCTAIEGVYTAFFCGDSVQQL